MNKWNNKWEIPHRISKMRFSKAKDEFLKKIFKIKKIHSRLNMEPSLFWNGHPWYKRKVLQNNHGTFPYIKEKVLLNIKLFEHRKFPVINWTYTGITGKIPMYKRESTFKILEYSHLFLGTSPLVKENSPLCFL